MAVGAWGWGLLGVLGVAQQTSRDWLVVRARRGRRIMLICFEPDCQY